MIEAVRQVNFSALQGMFAGTIFFLGTSLIAFLPRYKWLAAGLLLVFITPIALAGFWFSTGDLGISDWDYYFSMHHNLRKTLLEYKEFPFWNPYTCGGTAGLADPEFPVFSPAFLLELVFGVAAGFKLAIYCSIATTALGMLALARSLKLSVYAALLASLGVAFGSVSLLEIVEGHPNILAAMWIPWIFWSWLKAYRTSTAHHANRWQLLCGIFLALTFFQGGVYLLSYTALAFLALIVLVRHRIAALRISVYAGAWGLGLAAVKLIPALLWLQQFKDTAYASSAYTLPYLHKILLGRYLHNAGEIIPGQGSGWHEYGAYIGPIVLALAIVGSAAARQKRIVRILLISAILALLISSTGPLLKPLFDIAPFIPRSNITRVILFAVIPLALLAGYGLDAVRSFFPRTTLAMLLTTVIIAIAAADLMSLAYQLSMQAFVLPRVTEHIPPAPHPIAFTAHTYEYRYKGDDYTRAYAAALKGYGTLSYCSVLTPRPAVRTIHDEVDTGIVSLTNKEARYELLRWSPNHIHVRVTTLEKTDVTINTNYAHGWYVNDTAATENNGRVSTIVPRGAHTLLFRYKTPGFILGITITLATLFCAAIAMSSSLTDVFASMRKLTMSAQRSDGTVSPGKR